MSPLRMGVLGAARIVPTALLTPARSVAEVAITAIAARDPRRAGAFAKRHRIPRVLASYDELVDDPDIDAVYNPLPNGLHCAWTLRALGAGKHVLCEKPLASNAAEAEQMAEAAERAGRVLMEAFHWRYHPLAARMLAIVADGTLGRVQRIETNMCVPLLLPGNIRYDYARRRRHDGHRLLRGEHASSPRRRGAGGDPVAPQLYHRLTVRTREGKTVERIPGHSTYEHQLRAFAGAVLGGAHVLTSGRDGVANMRVIDRIYEKAGLPLRGVA